MPSETSYVGMTDETQSQGSGYSVNLLGSIVLGSFVALAMIMIMAYIVDHWDVLAVTRILDPLISAHIIQYEGMRYPGWIKGIPRHSLYFNAMEPIDWRLIGTSIVLFMLYGFVKSVQFHRVARLYGVPGTFGQHARAWLYGDGLDRFLPFLIGGVGTATALAKQGADFRSAHSATVVTQSFMMFEVLVFGAIGLMWVGWSLWLTEMFMAIVILFLAYVCLRAGDDTHLSVGRMVVTTGLAAFRGIAGRDPGELVKLCLISILAFMIFEMAFYLALESLTTVDQDFAPPHKYIFLSIIAGYLARMIPLTPGAIGQFELGCAAGFYIAGAVPGGEAAAGAEMSLALFVGALMAQIFRIGAATGMMSILVMSKGVPTNLSEVLAIFAGRERPPAVAPA